LSTRAQGKSVPRVLVADDNANIQKMVALALEEQGIDVVSVGNGEAAVRRIPDLAPDLVLADVFMPVRNGYEVCEFVKKDERFSHIPVILLVGAFDPLDEKEARRVGADGVLKKPFVPPDPLIAMVVSALEKNPKVAAEMAKEREAAQPKPEPELPPIALEAPARMAPKPLPDFPEPSPEEAALIYGFEKKSAHSSQEDAPARFAPKPEETEEEFDENTTANDWRRNAANFEVPEELGSKPAFSTDEDFGPVVFPSERDVPPKHYPMVSDDVTGGEGDARPRASFPARTFEPALVGETPFEHAASSAQPEPAASPEPLAPEPSLEATSEETAPASSEYSEESWMSAIFGKFRRPKPAQEDRDETTENSETAPEFVAPLSASAPATGTPSVEPGRAQEEEQVLAGDERAKLDSWFAPHPSVLRGEQEPSHAAPSAFSSEPVENLLLAPADSAAPRNSEAYRQADAGRPTPSSGFPWTDVTSMSSEFENDARQAYSAHDARTSDESSRDFAGSPVEANESPLQAFLPAPVEAPADQDSADDPAVHSVPSAPLFAPASLESMAETTDDAHFATGSGERIPTAPPPNREALAGIPFLAPSSPAPLESNPVESDTAEHAPSSWANEPTTHDAPSVEESAEPRTDLAVSHPPAQSTTPAAAEPSTAAPGAYPSVDAVVSRLLEKLEPQIHELLSKDLLKPLVENLIQQELANKK
jgi:CheY-like chemotaxis protein